LLRILWTTTILALWAGGEGHGQGYSYKKLAGLGDPAPGGGSVTFDFEPWSLNDAGKYALGMDVTAGDGASAGEVVVIGNESGEFQLLARSGQAAPGGGTYGQAFSGNLAINQRGDVAFIFPLLDCGEFCSGVYLHVNEIAEVVPLVRPGRPAPGGGSFKGGGASPRLNDQGQVVFGALIDDQFDPPPPPFLGYGLGIFLAQPDGTIEKILRAGDPAPGGKVFDTTVHPSINDHGDVVFGAHIRDEVCELPHAPLVGCGESLYLLRASSRDPAGSWDTTQAISIVHQGADAPGGGRFRLAFGGIINNRGDILFVGDLGPGDEANLGRTNGIYLYREGTIVPIARPPHEGFPGEELPGGGRLATVYFGIGTHHLNQNGEASFAATLVAVDKDGDGKVDLPDQGVYFWKEGKLHLVVRTGTVIDVGGASRTVAALVPPDLITAGIFPANFPWPFINGALNNEGQVLFGAALRDAEGNLTSAAFLATPRAAGFRRGDSDGLGQVDLTDAIRILNFLFLGIGQVLCLDAADSDDSGLLDLTDAIRILNVLFLGTGEIGPPGPGTCGPDPSEDTLGCISYEACSA
jgi:hypothetical protein